MIATQLMTTDILTVTPAQTIGEALELLSKSKIRQVPIINETKNIIGLITPRVLMEAILPGYITKGYLPDVKFAPDLEQFSGSLAKITEQTITAFMNKNKGLVETGYASVTPETTAMEIATIFINAEKLVDRVVVVDDEERILGIISPIDVFRRIWNYHD